MRNIRNCVTKTCSVLQLFVIFIVFSALLFSCANSPGNDPEIHERLLLLSSEVKILEEELEQLEGKWEQSSKPTELENEISELEHEMLSLVIELEECLQQKSEQTN